MRATLLLVLLLAAPAAAHAQDTESPAEAPRGPLRSETSAPRLASVKPQLPALREHSASARLGETARAEPSGRDFLYQIVLTAVSALVTALVWKAVF